MTLASSLRTTRTAVRRFTRRHRRPIAAGLAGLAALVAITALRAPAPAAPTATVRVDPTTVQEGESSVPVTLASGAMAGVLDIGDIVDLVAVHDDGTGEVVATGARVVEGPSQSGGIASSAGALIVVAVDDDVAVPLAVASTRDKLTVVINDAATAD